MPVTISSTKGIAMKNILPDGLLTATRLTKSGRLAEATAALRRMLGSAGEPRAAAGTGEPSFGSAQPAIPEALRGFLDQIGTGNFPQGKLSPGRFPLPGVGARPSPVHAPVAVPEGAQFLSATFGNQAGSRSYKLYVPSGYRADRPVPLIVMLHGCTQSPDDFAAGTRMNEAAEAHTCLVAYPAQTSAANMQKCWNWFNAGDQQRDGGEPSLIAGITRSVMREYAVDPRRVYLAGLSAGGAAAAIMGDAYPDLFAAIGVHSGLACGAARDVPSAFAAMQHGSDGLSRRAAPRIVPAIVFHGDRDATVNPRNGDAVVAQLAQAARLATRTEQGQVPGGHAWRRSLHADADGRTVVEQWVVHGAGHAWFGGSPAGSYTDPRGPDATKEMLRFFLEHQNSFG
jgi:poly(hydroxyalkanoate) depolymerase family esterase